MFCLRTLRELKLLKFLSEAGVSENVSATPDQHFDYCILMYSIDHLYSGYYKTSFVGGLQGGLLYVIGRINLMK